MTSEQESNELFTNLLFTKMQENNLKQYFQRFDSFSSSADSMSLDSPNCVIDLVPYNVVESLRGGAPMMETKRRRRRTKSVSFADDAYVYPNDRTPQEVADSWYDADELAVFKNERREVVRMLKRVSFNLDAVDPSICLRGYEAYFSIEVNRATKQARETLFTAVFCEQNRQRALGFRDSELIRRVSQHSTVWSLQNALALGSRDATESYMLNVKDLERDFHSSCSVRSEIGMKSKLCSEVRLAHETKRRNPSYQQPPLVQSRG